MKPLLLAAALLLLAGCHDSTEPPLKGGVLQTRLVGDITSGGHTSGEVMASAGKAPNPQPGPAGTPGIPKGAEGNTGGTAMGGTTTASTPGQQPASPAPTAASGQQAASPAPTAAASGPQPASAGAAAAVPGQSASAALMPASAASSPGLSDAQRQQQELTAAMDAVAARWHASPAAQGRNTGNPAGDTAASAQPSVTPAAAADTTIRSEKAGTAPPSPDVKTATKPVTPPVLDRKSPQQAGPKP